jgi:hypothetical protein
MEQELVERANLQIELIPAVGLRGKNPLAMAKGSMDPDASGIHHSRQVIKAFSARCPCLLPVDMCVCR